jgi:tetratricopeptide (TPR) repeat protein
VSGLLHKYKEQYPSDRDLWFYECVLALTVGELEKAQKIADKCVHKFPTSYESYYYQASVYQAKGMILEALKSYHIAYALNLYTHYANDSILEDIKAQIKNLEDSFEKLSNEYIAYNDSVNISRMLSFLNRQDVVWGKAEKIARDENRLVVGKEYWVTDDDLRYIGIYRAPLSQFIGEENLSLIRTKAEFLKFAKKGNGSFVKRTSDEYLLPIASVENDNTHTFQSPEEVHKVGQLYSQHFNYYRVKNGIQVESMKQAYYGYPIPLEHKQGRRKLVLSFFADGLAQEVINGDDFEKLMPNTYKFFSKGTICTQAHSCSEWTYPSLATCVSGLDTLHHMMFHDKLDGELPKNSPTLIEYFKGKGYYTSKMDGEWRSIPSYGYARGLDQYVYQHQSMGARAEQEIMDVIEHLETFKETDQYLWMAVGDLHDVADGLDLSDAVQKNLTLEERELDELGVTSVKQNYSAKKTAMYKKTIQYFDMLFGFLYTYIENNYTDDEILISLFADHGQGYLIPTGKPFLSKERTKVAFMFRGANVKQQVTDEIISTADYLPIMCRLADIQYDAASIDGKLPKAFGGLEEREYTITESLHPKDVYRAVANARDYEIHFENSEKTDEEGRFLLGDYKVFGFYKDAENTPITDAELLKRYENIFLERIAEHIIYE